MKVYILFGTYSDLEYHETFLGVYSTEENANKARQALEGENQYNQFDEFIIEESMLDENI